MYNLDIKIYRSVRYWVLLFLLGFISLFIGFLVSVVSSVEFDLFSVTLSFIFILIGMIESFFLSFHLLLLCNWRWYILSSIFFSYCGIAFFPHSAESMVSFIIGIVGAFRNAQLSVRSKILYKIVQPMSFFFGDVVRKVSLFFSLVLLLSILLPLESIKLVIGICYLITGTRIVIDSLEFRKIFKSNQMGRVR